LTCSPAVLTCSPAVLTCSPAVLTCFPAVLTCSPAVLACSPAVLACSPAVLTCSPAVLACSPAVLACSPAVLTCSPAVLTCSPAVLAVFSSISFTHAYPSLPLATLLPPPQLSSPLQALKQGERLAAHITATLALSESAHHSSSYPSPCSTPPPADTKPHTCPATVRSHASASHAACALRAALHMGNGVGGPSESSHEPWVTRDSSGGGMRSGRAGGGGCLLVVCRRGRSGR
ncbi:unnamed protein product, partial [Closterium sp. NIES-53]